MGIKIGQKLRASVLNTKPTEEKPRVSTVGTSSLNKRVGYEGETVTSVSMGSGSSGGSTQVGSVPLDIDLSPMMDGMDYDADDKQLFNVYRDIYFFDPICGSTVDLFSTLPFSDLSFSGAKDSVLEPYYEAHERLGLTEAFPGMSTDIKVTGAYVGSLLHDKKDKAFFDIMTHRYDNIDVTPLPFFNQDPILEWKIPEDIKRAFTKDSKRIDKLKKFLGEEFINKLVDDVSMELDPIGTLYIPRKTFSFGEGVSFFRRVLPIWLIEKNLYRGTLIESGRRQRGILHAQMGDGGDWEPSIEEMEFMTDLLLSADSDPIGSIICTRLGVNISEFRQGGDFWKITDIWDQTSQFKMRAMGISEAFLSGEACMAGQTLVATKEQGLIRIDSMSDIENRDRKHHNINVTVSGRYKHLKAKQWLYNGKRKTKIVKTELGNELQCTPNHPLLVLDTDGLGTSWVRTDRVKVGDMLCVPVRRTVRKTKLKLNLSAPMEHDVDWAYTLERPKVMTPELAYFLGIFISEGFWGNFDQRIIINNSNLDLLNHCVESFKMVFGHDLDLQARPHQRAGTAYSINGAQGTTNKDMYGFGIQSKQLNLWLEELGITPVRGEKSAAHYKDIPWCILQADIESQRAFLAAYLDGDGSVRSDAPVMTWISSSTQVTEKLQAMIQAMGYIAKRTSDNKRVTVRGYDCEQLSEELAPYVLEKHFNVDRDCKARNSYYLPDRIIKDFMLSRKVKDTRHGSYFKDDKGQEILVDVYKRIGDHNFLYDNHSVGKYDKGLAALKLVSLSTYNKLMHMLSLGYRYTEVTSIEDGDKVDVYDVSMGDQEPAFVANGIIVHNTYDNQQAGINIAVEYMKAFRDHLTRQVYYKKIFPLVSMMNGNAVNRSGKIIRKSGMLDGDQMDVMKRMQDGSRLFLPNVHWSKQLRPDVDNAMMENLRAMTELGVPVPLRTIAAAGGFNFDQILMDQDEDLALRRKIGAYKQRQQQVDKEYAVKEEEGGESFSSASASSVLGGRKRPGLRREFGEHSEIVGHTVTGKKKMIVDQLSANNKANNAIYKAVQNYQKNATQPLDTGKVSLNPSKRDVRGFGRF